ncbi:hypothetical protein [Aureimonas ureilytica]|uniref:hypothetical protein n=1 Tax=Aureimonas ureilytica TaxID=401562 RepID=UPI000A8BD926|nr:hypothetical protein [Aureimonas ureilytica]
MATVFIWNNNKVAIRGHTYPGHASMSIDDQWKFSGLANYVSFWPSSDSSTFTSAVKSDYNLQLKDDVESEGGYTPDHVIRLANFSKEKMFAEWSAVKLEYKNYQMLRNNCSSAVARVLKAGGQGGGVWQRHSVVWTPLKVKRLALAMGGTKMKWSALLDEMVKDGALTLAAGEELKDNRKRDVRHGIGSATGLARHAGGVRVGPSLAPSPSWATPSSTVSSGSMLGTSLTTIFDTIDALGGDDGDDDDRASQKRKRLVR